MSRGLILFAHGWRDPAWGDSLHALAREIEASEPGLQVRCAFLERLAPDLPTALAELAPRLTRLDVCPVFWAANGHVQRDLPALLDDARRTHPGVEMHLLPVLSELPGMLEFLARVILSLGHAPPVPAVGTSPAPDAGLAADAHGAPATSSGGWASAISPRPATDPSPAGAAPGP